MTTLDGNDCRTTTVGSKNIYSGPLSGRDGLRRVERSPGPKFGVATPQNLMSVVDNTLQRRRVATPQNLTSVVDDFIVGEECFELQAVLESKLQRLVLYR